MKPLILASRSPRRSDLLRRAGYCVEVRPSAVQELDSAALSPGELTLFNAVLKARDVARANPEAVVLGADTLVALGHRVFGKPLDRRSAHLMLAELAGKTHVVATGFCLVCAASRKAVAGTEFTCVTLKALTPDQIAVYHAQVDPLDKAGAYAAQSYAELVIDSVNGAYDNVIGLPLGRLRSALAQFEIFPETGTPAA